MVRSSYRLKLKVVCALSVMAYTYMYVKTKKGPLNQSMTN